MHKLNDEDVKQLTMDNHVIKEQQSMFIHANAAALRRSADLDAACRARAVALAGAKAPGYNEA